MLIRVLLFALVALAAVLRFYDLGAESLWNDELASWTISNQPSVAQVLSTLYWDPHPPGHILVLHLVIRFFGDSEAALRAFSAIAGVFSVPAIFLLGRRLFDARVGLIAAALLTAHWSPIFYAQEARAYAAMLLFAILASHFWVMIFLPGHSKKEGVSETAVVGYIASALCLAYLHYFGLFFVLFQGLLALAITVARPRHNLAFVIISLVFLAFYAPWMPTFLAHLERGSASWIVEPTLASFAQAQLSFTFGSLYLVYAAALAAFCYFSARALLGQDGSSSNPLHKWSLLYLSIWLAGPTLIVFAISVTLEPIWTPRNLIVVSPAAYLAVAYALTKIPIRMVGDALAAVALVFALAELVLVKNYYAQPQKEQFREIAANVCTEAPDEPIFYLAWGEEYFRYYLDDACGNYVLMGPFGFGGGAENADGDIERLVAELRTLGNQRFWYINGHLQPNPEFMSRVSAVAEIRAERQFLGGAARLFEVNFAD